MGPKIWFVQRLAFMVNKYHFYSSQTDLGELKESREKEF